MIYSIFIAMVQLSACVIMAYIIVLVVLISHLLLECELDFRDQTRKDNENH